MYKDACDRNAVEGRNGNANRRFGLDLIAAKLDETAKTEAALILLAMNAAYKLARWLFALFSGKGRFGGFLDAWGKNCIFSVGPNYAIIKTCLETCVHNGINEVDALIHLCTGAPCSVEGLLGMGSCEQ